MSHPEAIVAGPLSDAEPAVLTLEGVSKSFGGVEAVKAVSLTVHAGERMGVIGPNGAGKTTLFKLISGEEDATSGRIHYLEQDVTRMSEHRRAQAGFGRTFQVMELFPSLTVHEHFLLAGHASRRHPSAESRAVETAEELGLAEVARVPVSALAYGQQRLVELGMTLCSESQLLLFDEPAAGLGPADRVLLRQMIDRLPRTLTVVLVEHDIDLVLDLVDRVVCLSNGAVVADGSAEEIRHDPVVQEVYLGSLNDGGER